MSLAGLSGKLWASDRDLQSVPWLGDARMVAAVTSSNVNKPTHIPKRSKTVLPRIKLDLSRVATVILAFSNDTPGGMVGRSNLCDGITASLRASKDFLPSYTPDARFSQRTNGTRNPLAGAVPPRSAFS